MEHDTQEFMYDKCGLGVEGILKILNNKYFLENVQKLMKVANSLDGIENVLKVIRSYF